MSMLQTCADRVTQNYAAQTNSDPASLPPGTIGAIIAIITQLLPVLLGSCKPTTTTPTPTPADSANAIIGSCQNPNWLTHFRIRRAISNSGGLEPGMRMMPTVQAIIATGAMSTSDEVLQLAEETSN